MGFQQERADFERELDQLYATYPSDVGALKRRLDERAAGQGEATSYRRKALIYELAAEHCPVHLFRHCPFYFEVDAGRPRTSWGFEGLGRWLRDSAFGRRYERDGDAWKKPWDAFVRFNGRTDTDLDHHCAGYDNILRLGLDGLRTQAEERLTRATQERERSFLDSAVRGLASLGTISCRFSDRAEAMLTDETDPVVRRRLGRIAAAARRTPAEPPQTFYEALNTLVFMREILGSIEGIGISTFGHLDRMLGPYYDADVAAGRLDRAEAWDLLAAFLAFTDVKFDSRRAYHETSTTVFIGGCDRDGRPVYNEVTRLVVEVYRELGLINPKLQARMSPAHPESYFDLLAGLAAAGTNVVALYNDPVVIAANVRAGKREEDARLYVGGGCQENILQNAEISSRATLFFSAPAVLDMGIVPQRWTAFAEAEGLQLTPQTDCATFDAFYRAFLGNLRQVVDRLVANRNRHEANGWLYNPCPLLSSTISDCLETARDMTEGGCRYSSGSVDLAGIGTLVDSLYAVRQVVYERGDVSLAQLLAMVEADFEGDEAFRQYLLHRVPKFGHDDDEVRAFAAQVFADVAAAASGQANARGGHYGASLFAHRSSVSLGQALGATPDGRRAGAYLSQSMGPSLEALGSQFEIGAVLDALEPLDLTDYPVVGVLDLKLPAAPGGHGPATIKPVLRRFMDAGGSVMQLNVVDADVLREAQAHPERHPDLSVRVSGYSAYFATLSAEVQTEIIDRTEMQVR